MSSAKYVPCAYQPCTHTVTEVVLAPVLNTTLSFEYEPAPGVHVLVSVAPVPLTPFALREHHS